MKVAIIASALSGNKGAAAMLESAVQHLTERNPRARFVLLSMYPDSDARLNTHPNMRILRATPLRLGVLINAAALAHRLLPPLRRGIEAAVPEVNALASADVLLDQGGITFVDGRGKYLLYNVASILPALFLGTPIVKCAQAMGPFTEPANGLAAKALLPRMAAIVSRGAITHEHLVALGLRNVRAGADLAFTLQVAAPDVAQAESAADPAFFDSGDVVGYSPSAVLRKSVDAAGADYVEQACQAVDHITEVLGRKVFLVAHSARAHTDKTHNNDLPLCREIYARVASPEKVLFLDEELSPQALRHLIGRCDLFVASRFHAMVSSLAMGVPTVVVGWSHKYREVLDMLGQARWAMGHQEYSHERLTDMLDRLEAAKETVREEISSAAPQVLATAMEQLEIIEDVVAGRARGEERGAVAAS